MSNRPMEPLYFHAPTPNISVVVPCFGHSDFLKEALASLIAQHYPPVELLVVDDGSKDNCGQLATTILSTTLAQERKRQIERLVSWFHFSQTDLERFSDEVLLTANRGVAHARNTGIKRARGDWVVCLDGDDRVADSYFYKAMAHVALAPETNLVYADQQFFGESKWVWKVPELRVDDAIVRGPLPVMTMWRKELWESTPHGFDEVLPKGHEDWSYWLQLTRLQLRPHHIKELLTEYRYKAVSKMRNRERQNPEVPLLMRSLFPDLYPVRKLLLDHDVLLRPRGFSESVVMDVSEKMHLYPQRSEPPLWAGMILEAKGALAEAAAMYNRSKALAEAYDWQGRFRLLRVLEALGRAGEAARERELLTQMWGPAKMRWYA